VALAMNVPMQLSSSNSLISLAMTVLPRSGSGKTTTGSRNFGSATACAPLCFIALMRGETGALLVRGPTVFAHACKMGLEGIVSKRKDSAYRSGRSPDWLKMKNPGCAAVTREAEEDWAR
jgi:hypothetical protein